MERILFWKEWREQRWKAAFGTVMLTAFALIGLRSRIIPDEGVFAMVLFLGAVPLSLLAAMGVTGADRAEGSLDHLLSLPAPPGKILAIKVGVALATCLTPLVAAIAAALLYARGREFPLHFTLWGLGVAAWIATNLAVWTVAFGMTQRTEARVGLVGILVIAGWSIHMMALETFVHGPAERVWWALTPFGWLGWLDHLTLAWPSGRTLGLLLLYLGVQSFILVLLWLLSVKRFRGLSMRTVE